MNYFFFFNSYSIEDVQDSAARMSEDLLFQIVKQIPVNFVVQLFFMKTGFGQWNTVPYDTQLPSCVLSVTLFYTCLCKLCSRVGVEQQDMRKS